MDVTTFFQEIWRLVKLLPSSKFYLSFADIIWSYRNVFWMKEVQPSLTVVVRNHKQSVLSLDCWGSWLAELLSRFSMWKIHRFSRRTFFHVIEHINLVEDALVDWRWMAPLLLHSADCFEEWWWDRRVWHSHHCQSFTFLWQNIRSRIIHEDVSLDWRRNCQIEICLFSFGPHIQTKIKTKREYFSSVLKEVVVHRRKLDVMNTAKSLRLHQAKRD